MRTQATRHRASISPAALAEEDLARYVRYLDRADALAVYADYLTVGPRAPAAERALADLLVIRRCWDGLESYEPSHPLRRDAEAVKRSLGAMDAGDWERGGRPDAKRGPALAVRALARVLQGHGVLRGG